MTDFYPSDQYADTGVIYSYEGTDEVNALILGRAITGIGAFR